MYPDLMLVCCTFQKEEEKPKEKEKGKSRNIDHFMEELKHEQELRERRNQDREQWRDGRIVEHSIVSDTFSYLFACCILFGLDFGPSIFKCTQLVYCLYISLLNAIGQD